MARDYSRQVNRRKKSKTAQKTQDKMPEAGMMPPTISFCAFCVFSRLFLFLIQSGKEKKRWLVPITALDVSSSPPQFHVGLPWHMPRPTAPGRLTARQAGRTRPTG